MKWFDVLGLCDSLSPPWFFFITFPLRLSHYSSLPLLFVLASCQSRQLHTQLSIRSLNISTLYLDCWLPPPRWVSAVFICLLNRIKQITLNRFFLWNLVEGWAMTQGGTHYVLVQIWKCREIEEFPTFFTHCEIVPFNFQRIIYYFWIIHGFWWRKSGLFSGLIFMSCAQFGADPNKKKFCLLGLGGGMRSS